MSEQTKAPAPVAAGMVEKLNGLFNFVINASSAEECRRRVINDLIPVCREAAALLQAREGDARDAARYRWLRDRVAIEDIERLDGETFGCPFDERESIKTDAAIDAALRDATPPASGEK